MSVLSTITGSLPNLLNLLQGTWTVQYRKRVPPKDDLGDAWDKLDMTSVSSIGSFVNSVANVTDDGFEDLDFDSFIDIQEIDDSPITKVPVENGSFRTVNKITNPKQIKVTLAKAGIGYGIEDTLAEIKSLISKARYGAKNQNNLNEMVDTVKGMWNSAMDFIGADSLKTEINPVKTSGIEMEFRVVTPFDMIERLNLIKLDYTFKKDNGRNMLLMYLTFQEIMGKSGSISSVTKTVKTPTDSLPSDVGRLSTM